MARVSLHPQFLLRPIAHRGYHDKVLRRPENSLSAFQAAIDAGYGIELDVQLTADGQAVVFHDETLDRMTTESGAVVGRTTATLGTFRLCDSDDFIPTLPDVLSLVAGQVPVLIEIKDCMDTMSETSGKLEAAVATALEGYKGPVAVMSFNPHCIINMQAMAPEIARGLTTEAYDPQASLPIPPDTCARLRMIPDFEDAGCSFISHQATDLNRPRVAELKSQGADILCWTIRSPAAEARARLIAQNITFEGYAAT